MGSTRKKSLHEALVERCKTSKGGWSLKEEAKFWEEYARNLERICAREREETRKHQRRALSLSRRMDWLVNENNQIAEELRVLRFGLDQKAQDVARKAVA